MRERSLRGRIMTTQRATNPNSNTKRKSSLYTFRIIIKNPQITYSKIAYTISYKSKCVFYLTRYELWCQIEDRFMVDLFVFDMNEQSWFNVSFYLDQPT